VAARDARSRLVRRAAKADISLNSALADRLTAFLELLFRWNRKINLTALHDVDDAVDRLLLEPLAAVRHVPHGAGRLIDIGSGGGSPAIPLALARADLDLTMVEIKARKAAFLREAVRVLELSRALVETRRYEDLLGGTGHRGTYTALSIRALRVEAAALRDVAEFLAPDGVALLFRGPTGPDVLADADPLAWTGTYPLLESLQSRVSVFRRIE
jgi:16S rRNA (guanine527-N7)-methyltransferase